MSRSDHPSPPIGGQLKITADHLQRLACIYIRQSTLKQVEKNLGGRANQYQLVQCAEALGWGREQIRVIDTDLGLSGRESANRDGFKELVAEVSLGHVGIILSYEVSRLARNNSDWYHLLDLAAVFRTLISDSDGIYDPRQYNDRLLLGLKGTMSEAELHLLRLRMDAGRMNRVRSGEYRVPLPTGLTRLPDGTVVKDPDDQVRHAIELVFAKFEELGACQQVLRYLVRGNLLLPRHHKSGFHRGELLWKRPTIAAVYAILRNPAYAGAFAYGRRQTDLASRQPELPWSGRVRKSMQGWIHLQQNVYPAYITWEQYLANQERLHQNAMRFTHRTRRAQGAAREGAALLQGLVVCGKCGHHMKLAYKSPHRYFCNTLATRYGEPTCDSLNGPSVDEVVVKAFFDALQPSQLDALEAVLAAQQAEQERLTRQWEERTKRARYEARLAQRQYDAVDPDNRLVAAELERRWEEKLRQLQSTQEAYERFSQTCTPTALPPEFREQLQRISETLPELWEGGQISNAQKKELLRCLIDRVILTRQAGDRIEVRIVWVSGHYSLAYAQPQTNRQCDVTGYEEMVKRTGELWEQGLNDRQIADKLTEEGFHTARSTRVPSESVQRMRLANGWQLFPHQHGNILEWRGRLTALGLAARLGVQRIWVYRRLRSGQIDPKYVTRHPQSKVYLIQDDPEMIEQLRQLLPKKQRAEGGI